MNKYLMQIRKYFGGFETFEMEGETKQDATEKAKQMVTQDYRYNNGDYDRHSVKCLHKINIKSGKKLAVETPKC